MHQKGTGGEKWWMTITEIVALAASNQRHGYGWTWNLGPPCSFLLTGSSERDQLRRRIAIQ
jgi:hypothetical protein